jgi:hypothetical protein
MTLKDIISITNGKLITGFDKIQNEVSHAFASDLMSDVLTLQTNHFVLLTGLVTIQTIRTAEMADIDCIIFVRNKRIPTDVIELAKDSNMAIIECPYSMFKTCGILFEAGIKAVY